MPRLVTTLSELVKAVTGDEKSTWWEYCVAAWPDFANYQTKTDREIPVFVLEPTA